MRRFLSFGAMATMMLLVPSGGLSAAAPSVAAGLFHPPVDVLSLDHSSVSSTNWSGYAVESSSEFTEAQGSWVQPTATCNETVGATYASFWVGIDGYTSDSVEQLGTDSDCTAPGSPSYYAWWEMYPSGSVDLSTSTYPVKPGDTLTGTVSRTADTYTLKLTSSRGWTFTTTQVGTDANSSAEWITEAPEVCTLVVCTGTQLTDFGTVNDSASEAAAGGSLEPISSFTTGGGPFEITMTTETGSTEAQPSALNSSGTGFSVSWEDG